MLVLVVVLASCAQSGRDAVPSENALAAAQVPQSDPNASKVLGFIRPVAARAGRLDPGSTRWVYGTRSRIAALLKFGIPADEGAHHQVLVTARGRFVLTKRGPRGTTVTVSGTVLELIYDTTTWQVTDFGITRQAPELAAVGHVYTR